MKPIGAAVNVAWPHDGHVRDRNSGEPLSRAYKAHGLHMLHSHATHPDGSISTEAGIMEMYERMRTGRFKVAAHCVDWFEEFRGLLPQGQSDREIQRRFDECDKNCSDRPPLCSSCAAWRV